MTDLLKNRQNSSKKLVALIDGEHYPGTNLDAINKLKKTFKGTFAGIIFLGGTEKLLSSNLDSFYGHKVIKISKLENDFIPALKTLSPDYVYDLSDEPVVNYMARAKIASYCLACRCTYMGPDFCFEHEAPLYGFTKPSLLIIGTGKRIGKTGVSSYIASLISKKRKVCILAMGRGGPAKPILLKGSNVKITPQYLLDISRKGMHASSDYIEDALFSKVDTVGCRRCGGGFGGKFFLSNISQGVKLCEKTNPDIIIVEGSGASVPPVKTDRCICLIGADQEWGSIAGYLGIYRILISDMVILTMCEEPVATGQKISTLEKEIRSVNPDIKIIKTIFRPEPLYPVEGKRVFMLLTAKSGAGNNIKQYLEKEYCCKVTGMSFNLANRDKLKEELQNYNDYDVLLSELKAASVDMVTEFAASNGKDINYMNNIPVITEGAGLFNDFIKDLETSAK
jgi:cyclic 2,3-diphosphoglycerate synthetase